MCVACDLQRCTCWYETTLWWLSTKSLRGLLWARVRKTTNLYSLYFGSAFLWTHFFMLLSLSVAFQVHKATTAHENKHNCTTQQVIIIYDLRTATKWRILEGHEAGVTAISFNPKGCVGSCSFVRRSYMCRVFVDRSQQTSPIHTNHKKRKERRKEKRNRRKRQPKTMK